MRFLLSLLLCLLWLSSPAFARPEIHLNIPEYVLRLMDDGRVLREYRVAVGTPYEPTPPGKYLIAHKEKNPTWYPGSGFADKTPVPPGPSNPLGTRWIEFLPTYGIHGTDKAWSIEYPVSGGCIRMYNQDVEELYELVDIGTPVIISYQTLVLNEKPDGLYLTVYADVYGKQPPTKALFDMIVTAYRSRYPSIAEPVWPVTVEFPAQRTFKLASR